LANYSDYIQFEKEVIDMIYLYLRSGSGLTIENVIGGKTDQKFTLYKTYHKLILDFSKLVKNEVEIRKILSEISNSPSQEYSMLKEITNTAKNSINMLNKANNDINSINNELFETFTITNISYVSK
jgi:hypothetical protein